MTGLSRRSRLEVLIQGAWSCHIARLSCVSPGGGGRATSAVEIEPEILDQTRYSRLVHPIQVDAVSPAPGPTN
jgi:hypothetical protein